MFKKTVTFKDFDGNSQTQDFYFHISKAEFLAMASTADDMQSRIKKMVASMDGKAIIHELREIIKLACGVRSEDGQRFVKDAAAQSTLLDSPAFDELLMELATDAVASAEFIEKLVPKKMQEEMQEQLKKSGQAAPEPFADKEDARPAYQKEGRQPTNKELQAMTHPEMVQAFEWAQRNRVTD